MADQRSVTSSGPDASATPRAGAEPRAISGEAQGGDKKVDHALRPRSLDEMVGQERLRDKIRILVEAARQREEALDHVLLYGPARSGKNHAEPHPRQRDECQSEGNGRPRH